MVTQRKGTKWSKTRRSGAVFLALVICLPVVSHDSHAQEMRERRTLFEMMFGSPIRRDDRMYEPERSQQQRMRRPPPQRDNRAVTPPPAPRKTPSVVQMRTCPLSPSDAA
ncbi:hypothetical protein, partial [Klebsiella pneumoniae]|uniref:hypothetical protein n=1 Tax=Klebsiella pneumoniae TaxID=573 RepID=UPI001C7261C7